MLVLTLLPFVSVIQTNRWILSILPLHSKCVLLRKPGNLSSYYAVQGMEKIVLKVQVSSNKTKATDEIRIVGKTVDQSGQPVALRAHLTRVES